MFIELVRAMDPEACLGILSRAHAAAKGSDWERFNFSATGEGFVGREIQRRCITWVWAWVVFRVEP